jgi:hypothetical protein
MHIAYKAGKEQPKTKKPTKKELLEQWALQLVQKWKIRDEKEALKKIAKYHKVDA